MPQRGFDPGVDANPEKVPHSLASGTGYGQPARRVDVELPAVAPEDIEVSCKDGLLTISGERKYQGTNDDERVHRTERLFGRFARSFRLPDDADEDCIEATAAQGVITISVSKRENARARSIEVKPAN